jgi:hypothetical protein
MAIPNKQIGWGATENLLWNISKQLERLIQVTGSLNSTTTTTTTAAP